MDNQDQLPRIDPEPLSTLIIALGAAGSVASLVSLIENRLRARGAERQANQAAIRDAILGAETSLNELRALVRSLEIAFVAGLDTRNMGRVHFAEFFRSLEEVIGNCGDVMRELRMELYQWLR